MKELINIQSELKAPKNQINSFGKYKYRSCEDILEAVKPLLKVNNCTLTLSDEIKSVADSIFYVEATAILKNSENETVEVKACAGIETNKRGMDLSQSFGSSSSYARKYALNGLFCIDDTKDSDTNESKLQAEKTQPKAVKKANSDTIDDAISAVKKAKSQNELLELFQKYPQYQRVEKFKNTLTKRKHEVTAK